MFEIYRWFKYMKTKHGWLTAFEAVAYYPALKTMDYLENWLDSKQKGDEEFKQTPDEVDR